MKDRLKQLRKELGLTQGEFGEKIGLTNPMISLFESGKKIPQDFSVKLICRTFGVREDWLRSGEGPMKDEKAQLSEKGKRLLSIFEELSDNAQDMILDNAEKLVVLEQALRREAAEPRDPPGIGPRLEDGKTG